MLNSLTDELPIIQQGSGDPVLIFLHYFSGSSASWQWVTEILKTEFCCVAPDLPGFGSAPSLEKPSLKGYSDYVVKIVERLGIDRCVLIGHSMGGKIALQVAADNRIKGLERVVLVAPSPVTQEPMPQEERERLLENHPSEENAATTVDSASQSPLPRLRRMVAIKTHTKADDLAWRWWLLEGMNHSIADQMGQIRVPVSVIASKQDPVIPFETIKKEVVDLIPQATLIELSGVGHLIPLEAPQKIAQQVRKLVQQTH